jgi:F0F1-type ATP synthase membrane subunit a
MIGARGVQFAPYLTTLFSFVLLMNLWGIIPLVQISPNSHIAFPAILAVISYIMFIYVGVREHGFVNYFKNALIPPAPWFILLNNFWGIVPFVQISPNSHIAFPAFLAIISYLLFIIVGIRHHGVVKYFKTALIPPAPWFILPLLIPIEFFSNFLVRPFSLAVRLFANMFAGHMLLLVFTLGGFAMISENVWFTPFSIVSWIMTIALTLLEFLVICLQAYVFTVLTASYVQGALADEH